LGPNSLLILPNLTKFLEGRETKIKGGPFSPGIKFLSQEKGREKGKGKEGWGWGKTNLGQVKTLRKGLGGTL